MKKLLLIVSMLSIMKAHSQDSSYFRDIDSTINRNIEQSRQGKFKFNADTINIKRFDESLTTTIQFFTDTTNSDLKIILYAVPTISHMSEDVAMYHLKSGILQKVVIYIDSDFDHPTKAIYFEKNAAYELKEGTYVPVDGSLYQENFKKYIQRYKKQKFLL